MATIQDPDAVQALEPDPLEPSASEVESYVAALQEVAASEPARARRAAWNQIRLAGARAGRRRTEAHETLGRLFRRGAPPDPPLDGPYLGIAVTPTTWPPLDLALRAVVSQRINWLGKRFDAATETGDNVLAAGGRAVALLGRRYEVHDAGDGNHAALPFRTLVGPGTHDADRETLKIDYDRDENPRPVRSILDELVQVVPGVYLGKALLRLGSTTEPKWRLVGYFALLAPEPAPDHAGS